MNPTTLDNGTINRHPKGRRPAPGERERILAEWAASERTVVEMAAATGWSTHSLYRWRHEAGQRRRRKLGSAPTAGLLAVPKPAATTAPWAAELAIGEIRLRLAPGSPVGWAADLVRELQSC